MLQNEITYKEIIEQKGFFIATPVGTSMNPLLISRVDTVKLVKPENIKKYDVILYKRKSGQFVLHRVVGKNKNGFILCGDNQTKKEYKVTDEMILGKMEGFYKGEEYIPVTDEKYIRYSKRRVGSIPLRRCTDFIKRIIHKLFRRKKNVQNKDS